MALTEDRVSPEVISLADSRQRRGQRGCLAPLKNGAMPPDNGVTLELKTEALHRNNTPRHQTPNRALDGSFILEELPEFHRLIVTPTLAGHKPSDSAHKDVGAVSKNIVKALELREQFVFTRRVHQDEDPVLACFDEDHRKDPFTERAAPPADRDSGTVTDGDSYAFTIGRSGVAELTRNGVPVTEWAPPSLAAFSSGLVWLYQDVCNGKSERTFAHKRLQMLEKNFIYYQEMNWSYEAEEIRFSRSDFRNVVKVDTHIHAASAFTRCELLDFIMAKLQDPKEAKRIVATADDGKGERLLVFHTKTDGFYTKKSGFPLKNDGSSGGLKELTLVDVLTGAGLSTGFLNIHMKILQWKMKILL